LLIATYEYEDLGLRRLTTPAHDAEALAAVLEDPEIAGFEVRTLVNAPTHEVGEAIAEFYAESTLDDLTLLYFTGHGLKDDNGRLHLAMSNTRRDRLRFTALSAQLVDEAMTDSRSRQKILILDCCYSGSYEIQQYAKSDSAVHTLEKLGGRGRTVLTASDSTQYAFEGSTIHGEAAQSVFTRHLVEGLRDGTADLDHDGDITVDELYNYVYDRVTAEQPNQRPKKLDQVEGRTVIAANIHWSLPAHLIDALASPIPSVRLAAVEPVGQLLWSANDLVRRTARARLEQLLQDDSRAVSDAARAHLDAPAPAPVPTAPPREFVRRPVDQISVGAAMRASTARWRARVMPTGKALIPYLGTLLAAAAFIAAALIDRGRPWYFVTAALVMMISVAIQHRLRARPISARAVVAGLTFAGMFGALQLLDELSFGVTQASLLVTVLSGLGHAAWIIAGILAWRALRRAEPITVRVLGPSGKPTWILIGLGAATAVAQLVILAYSHYHSVSELHWRSIPSIALGVLATESAIAGPLLATFVRPRAAGSALLGGWILGGIAIWTGLYLPDRAGAVLAVVALFAAWMAIGVMLLVRRTADEDTGPGGRKLAVLGLVLPIVLGTLAATIGPHAAKPPLILGVVVSEGNDLLYGADIANGTVIRISTATRTQVGDAVKVGRQPSTLLLDSQGHRLYVSNSGANSISVIDTGTWKAIGKPVPVGPEPLSMALNASGHQLFVLSRDAASVTVVDTDGLRTVGGPLSAGTDPTDLAVEPDGSRLYVANANTSALSVIDTRTLQPARSPIKLDHPVVDLIMGADGGLVALGPASFSIVNTAVDDPRPGSFSLPGKSVNADLSPDGKRLVVLGSVGESSPKDAITVVNVKSHRVEGSVPTDKGLTVRIAVSPDGQRAYVSRFFEDGILVIDTSAAKEIGTITFGR